MRRRALFGRNQSTVGRDFSIFQDGGRRHLGFFKFQIFNGRTAQEGGNASPCQIWSKSVNWRPRYCDFSIFQDGGGQIWSKSVETRPRYGDFSIFQDGRRPPSWICVQTTHEGHFMVFIAVQNLVGIDAVALIICMFFDFRSLA